ncbi:hypothetical protein KBK19_10445 [Microvirga sp. STR05]|uniref:Uncharacterized protein n=1 Tax=Hymenobacter duratus TaxID=2771356 RepID=A0ABR8JKX7_9BACT|nr:hypothetical protein [Hymenobacter duratus]MBD2715454.1 hypothetical protein [Hymenobacter duratus]MBR7950362.1 hypothetical protein [Microvirga sp. STR05]
MILFNTRFLYPVSAVKLQEQQGLLPAEFLQTVQLLQPFLEKEKAYGEVCFTQATSPRGRQLVVQYRKTYSPEHGFIVEILDAEVARPLARVA